MSIHNKNHLNKNASAFSHLIRSLKAGCCCPRLWNFFSFPLLVAEWLVQLHALYLSSRWGSKSPVLLLSFQIKKNLNLIPQRLFNLFPYTKTLLMVEKIQMSVSRNSKARVKAYSRALLTAVSRSFFLPSSFSRLAWVLHPSPYSCIPYVHRTVIIFHSHCILYYETSETMYIPKSSCRAWWRGP